MVILVCADKDAASNFQCGNSYLMDGTIVTSYLEFEERVGVMDDTGVKSSSYDVVKAYVETKIGKFTPADVLANCPGVGRTSVFNALKNCDKKTKTM